MSPFGTCFLCGKSYNGGRLCVCIECIMWLGCEISTFLPPRQCRVAPTGRATAETGGLLILSDPPTRRLRDFYCWTHALLSFTDLFFNYYWIFLAFFCLLGLVLWIALVFEADAWIRGNGFWKMFPNKLEWTTINLTKIWQTSPNNSVYSVSATCIVVVGPLWPDHYKIFYIWGIWKMLKFFAVI